MTTTQADIENLFIC